MKFGGKVTLNETTGAAPALAVVNPAFKGEPAHLVIGWTGTGNLKLNGMVSIDGKTFGGKMTINQSGYAGLAIVSPSADKLDIAWTGVQTGPRHLNFMQV